MPGNQQVFSTAINAADRFRWDSQWMEAAQEYQRALAEFPEDATARGGLGFCYMQTKQWQAALDEYEYILKRDASNVIALSKTAELYGILGRRNDAYRAYLLLADLYSQAGQGARAEAAWQKSVQLAPGNPEPHERLAAYYFEKKDIALMIQERLAAAQGYLARNERTQARMQCEEALRADASNTEAQQLFTQIMGMQGSPQGTALSAQTYKEQSAHTTQSSGPLAFNESASQSQADSATTGNISGGNTGNMGNAGNYGGANYAGSPPVMGAGNSSMGGQNSAPNARKRILASQVTGVLKQAQTFQAQGRFNDAIDLCEQIIESGIDRPDARYFLGWLYQEQQRWDDAIRQFQLLLNDPDYALSCYYALGQCYRARGDLRTAAVHFDEAVDRVNLDALTVEESDQLVQLCQEAADAHRMLGEQEQALTVYNALLGFLRSRGWSDKVAQVEFMLQQIQDAPSPPQSSSSQNNIGFDGLDQKPQTSLSEAATMAFHVNVNGNNGNGHSPNLAPTNSAPIQPTPPPPAPPTQMVPVSNPNSSVGELPDWLTGILSEADKAQIAQPQNAQPAKPSVTDLPTMEQRVPPPPTDTASAKPPVEPLAPVEQPIAAPSWLTEDIKPTTNTSGSLQSEQVVQGNRSAPLPVPIVEEPLQPRVVPAPAPQEPVQQAAAIPTFDISSTEPAQPPHRGAEDLLNQMAGTGTDVELKHVAETVLTSTAALPESIRLQVMRSMQDIQRYINHGLLNSATEECLKVIDMAPQYLDVHQVLCEIYVRQGKIEQAITKYAILVDTYIINGRTEDAIATYRRILQLEPNNLTYRMRLINLLTAHGNKEDLLRERTMAAESYLRLGYTDRALTELEQALQESPTSIPTRLNYALALQKLGRSQQAVTEYQRVLQIDPRNLTALVRWHISMTSTPGTSRATILEVLSRVCWQLRGEGQKHYDAVAREYIQAADMYPNNADLIYSLGQIHQQAGNYDKAIDVYNQAMRDSIVEVLARTSAAQCFLAQGKPEAAIQQLEQALQSVRRSPNAIDPGIWAARPREAGEEHQAPEMEISLMLAKAYERTGRMDQKEAILRQVRQARPGQNEVAPALAEISARQGDVSGALQEYTDLVKHYRANKQTDNALGVLNEMVRLAPQDPRAHAELADIYVTRGHLDEGIAELRLLTDIYLRRNQFEPASEALQRVGTIYAEIGDNDEALANLRRAAELNPDSMELLREVVSFSLQLSRTVDPKYTQDAAKYQAVIARHYFDTHQVKESVAALQQLITIDRSNHEAYDLLGQTYQSVGEYEQASRVYRNLAKLAPDSDVARERLAMLQELRTR
jgi:tetratricopeptide (TPR) repeat protein